MSAGYKAVLLGSQRLRPLLPAPHHGGGARPKPANVLILGIGVAGLQAIGTARRSVRSWRYDVRPRPPSRRRASVPFVKLKTTIDATGAGGYARELTPEERAAQQAELNEVIGGMDVVITTAQVRVASRRSSSPPRRCRR